MSYTYSSPGFFCCQSVLVSRSLSTHLLYLLRAAYLNLLGYALNHFSSFFYLYRSAAFLMFQQACLLRVSGSIFGFLNSFRLLKHTAVASLLVQWLYMDLLHPNFLPQGHAQSLIVLVILLIITFALSPFQVINKLAGEWYSNTTMFWEMLGKI